MSLQVRQGLAIQSLNFVSLRGRSRRELTWQSSLGRYVGCPDDAMGCLMVPLDCRVRTVSFLAMTGCGGDEQCGSRSAEWAGRTIRLQNTLTLRCHCEPAGCGNPVGVVMWDAGTMRGDAQWFRWNAASLRSSQWQAGRDTGNEVP
ncbi:MAG: hypothetical protein O3B25_11775 [Verrucomicrobia bacterium]|nr:hypothetical protein [Verrucomicrobiota bacterium]